MPPAADLADVWLVHALECLLDACEVPEGDRGRLVESGIDAFEPEPHPTENGEARLARLDACRRALVFAPLALEARLNRILRRCDPAEWRAVAHLAPPEKFRLAPRLLDELEWAAEDAELSGIVVELFAQRDELVEAGEWSGPLPVDAAGGLSPGRACELVEASAKVCHFLATLTAEEESTVARLVREAAAALTRRAGSLSSAKPAAEPEWSEDVDFPPDVGGS